MRGCYCNPCCHDDRCVSEAEEHLLESSHDTPERGRTTFQDMYFFFSFLAVLACSAKVIVLLMIRIVRTEKQKGRL